jgi:hypothetical protein
VGGAVGLRRAAAEVHSRAVEPDAGGRVGGQIHDRPTRRNLDLVSAVGHGLRLVGGSRATDGHRDGGTGDQGQGERPHPGFVQPHRSSSLSADGRSRKRTEPPSPNLDPQVKASAGRSVEELPALASIASCYRCGSAGPHRHFGSSGLKRASLATWPGRKRSTRIAPSRPR